MTLGSMEKGEGSAAQLIQLEPLIHQVSGHSSLWVLDDESVCKPLIGREALFYRTLPPQMRAFTPEFRGTVKVLVQKTAEGVAVAALPPEHNSSNPPISSPAIVTTNSATKSSSKHSQNSISVRSRKSSSTGSKERDAAPEKEDPCGLVSGNATALPAVHQPPQAHNPWLQQCHQRYLNKLKLKVETKANVMECILLENLTHVYRVPNVLDLKMGTRQYGDDAPESKRRSQTRKALHTTTPRLGVRLAGMQVFNRDTKCYVCKNKYVGRELTEEGFQQTLKHFLHNGRRFRIDIVDQIICKLTDLRNVIASLDSFRFFTSSLLILYDSYDAKGSQKPKEKSPNTKVIDDQNKNRTSEPKSFSSKSSDQSSVLREKKHNSRTIVTASSDCSVRDCHKEQSFVNSVQKCTYSSSCGSGSCVEVFNHNNSVSDKRTISCSDQEFPQCHNEEQMEIDDNFASATQQQTVKQSKSSPKSSSSAVNTSKAPAAPTHKPVTSAAKPSSTRPLTKPLNCNSGKPEGGSTVPERNVPDRQISSENQNVPDRQSSCSENPFPAAGSESGSTNSVTSNGVVSAPADDASSCFRTKAEETTSRTKAEETTSRTNPEDTTSRTKAEDTTSQTKAEDTTSRTKVDIRLIDFAHATHKGMGDATIYSGPDEGLMLGLKSLITIFTNIKELYTK